jgi:hypothetical protein
MNCTEFDQHWQRRLDVGAGLTPVQLMAHLAECPRCQTWHRAWETLEQAIDDTTVNAVTEPLLPQPVLVDRVLAELQSGPAAPSEPVRPLPFELAALSVQETGPASVAGLRRQFLVRRTALASALLVLGVAWFLRPLARGPERPSPPERASAATSSSSMALIENPNEDEAAGRSVERELANTFSKSTGRGESFRNEQVDSESASSPPIVKPLVGVVHNLTSLVLPGWPSAFNDSVGIPHYLEGEGFAALPRETLSPPVPAPLALVRGTEVSWLEPVEELLAVATESVQTMWDLASRW